MKPLPTGDLGRLINSSLRRMKPLEQLEPVGDRSSDEGEDNSDFLQTSRCRSMEPGRVRGGILFCGEGRPG